MLLQKRLFYRVRIWNSKLLKFLKSDFFFYLVRNIRPRIHKTIFPHPKGKQFIIKKNSVCHKFIC